MNRRRIALIVVAVVVVAAAAVFVVRRNTGRGALEASGTVEATEAQLGFTVPGRIDSVLAWEGDTVRTGDDLARLDRATTLATREQAAAQAAAARATLLELERGSRPEEIGQARAAATAAKDQLTDAQRDADRAKALKDQALISQQEYDKTMTAFDVARSRSQQADEALRMVEQGPRREQIDAARAQLNAAEASVRALDATLANMVVRAPFDGLVTVRHREPGEIVQAGSPVLSVLNRADRWVRIYVPETDIGAVHPGQPAHITTDTFGDRTFGGTVSMIASEAEFTPKTVQTQEERVKLVYAVKVRITGDPGYALKPGMPADVVLEHASK